MTEPIQLESKGLLVEVWLTAKGDKQYRIKANDLDPLKVDGLTKAGIEILKNRFDIDVSKNI